MEPSSLIVGVRLANGSQGGLVEGAGGVAEAEVMQGFGAPAPDHLLARRHPNFGLWEVHNGLLERMAFCNGHSLTLVAQERDGDAEGECGHGAAFLLAAQRGHGDGDVRGWQAGDEFLVVRDR